LLFFVLAKNLKSCHVRMLFKKGRSIAVFTN